jgi:hypothetical protein
MMMMMTTMHAVMMMIKQRQAAIAMRASTYKQQLTNKLACRRAPQDSPGSSSTARSRGTKKPASSQVMYMHPIANPTRSVNSNMRWRAHTSVQLTCANNSAVAMTQRQAAERLKNQPSSGRNNEGALRQCMTPKRRTRDGSSLPDAAAAAALNSSAAARRIQTRERH